MNSCQPTKKKLKKKSQFVVDIAIPPNNFPLSWLHGETNVAAPHADEFLSAKVVSRVQPC